MRASPNRVPAWVRRRIGVPPGALPMSVRFGAGGAASPGVTPQFFPEEREYSLTPEQSDAIERVIRDNSSPDLNRQKAARDAWNNAIRTYAPALGPVGLLTMGANTVAQMVLDIMGYGVMQDFSGIPGGTAFYSNGDQAAIVSSLSVGTPDAQGYAAVSMTAVWTLLDWTCTEFYSDATEEEVTRYQSSGISASVNGATTAGCSHASPTVFHALGYHRTLLGACPSPLNLRPARWGAPNDPYVNGAVALSCLTDKECVSGRVGDGSGGSVTSAVCVGDSWEWPGLDFGDVEGLGPLSDLPDTPPDYKPTEPELEDIADDLLDSPWNRDFPPVDPTNPTVPAPAPELFDPGFPCAPGEDPTMPTDPNDPGTFPELPPGPGDSPIENPIVNIPGPGEIEVPDCPPAMPGERATMNVGGKAIRGKVARYEPSSGPGDPCDFVIDTPPYADEDFTENRCYKNERAVEIAAELAVELGIDPDSLIIEEDCTERFTGCFKKGSSKFDAMWAMLDLCGFGFFPDPDPGPIIGPVKPLNVHWGPYHEDEAVFEPYERAYDSLDMPSHVEYFRPAGKGLPRLSVVVPVRTVYELPHDKWETFAVAAGTSERAMMDAARRKAREVGMRGNAATITLPLNMNIKQRHQVEIRRPSVGFSANYMAVALRHDFDSEEGHVTQVEGRELGAVSYHPDPGGPGRSARGLGSDI